MASTSANPPFIPRQFHDFPRGVARDYRLMVEAVQEDDLDTARAAYGRMMERLSTAGGGSDDALARIGESLRSGDLVTAQRTLDGLEGKALQVLRGLRAHMDLIPTGRGGTKIVSKPN